MSTVESRAESAPTQVPGEAGVWIFILLDLTVFAIFFGTALYYRIEDPAAFAAGQGTLHVPLAVVNTVLLVTGSLVVVRAVQAARTRQISTARRYLAAAIASGIGFMAIKAIEYGLLLSAGHTLFSDRFFLCYFAFTGIHLVHVVIGVVVLAAIRRGLTRGLRIDLVESGACYWHMVDLIWLVLFPLLYLLG